MKKIIHIITGLKQAGAETLLYRLATTDENSSHTVISLTSLGYYGPLLVDKGIEVYELNLSWYNFFLKTTRMISILRSHSGSTVHCWMYHSNLYGGFLAKSLGFKSIIWSIHHLNSSSLKGITRFISKLCALLSKLIPSKIVFVSEESLEFHIRDGYSENISKVIYNFVDTDLFRPSIDMREKFRAEINISDDTFVFGSVARWHPIKGHTTIFSSFSELCSSNFDLDYVLVLVGPGMVGDNKDLVQQLESFSISDRVILLGAKPQLEEIYPAFDVHILASINEAFGMVTLEALSCGISVISSNVGFAHRFISNPKALFEPANSQQLLASMIYSSQVSMLPTKISPESDFSISVALEKYNDLWLSKSG